MAVIKIRDEQLTAFSDAKREEIASSVKESVARHWSGDGPGEGAGALEVQVDEALKMGLQAGLSSEKELTAFAQVCQLLGPKLAAQPDAKGILSASGMNPAEKLAQLLRIALASEPDPEGGPDNNAKPRVEPSPFAPPLPSRPAKSTNSRKLILLRAIQECEELSIQPVSRYLLPCQREQPRVTINIQEAPLRALLAGLPAPTITLHAINRNPAVGGTLTWTILNGHAFVNALGPVNLATLSIAGVAAGSAVIQLRHDYGGQFATDQIIIEVVTVVLQQAPRVVHPFGAAIPMLATGTPGGGAYSWNLASRNEVDFPGGVDPQVAAFNLNSIAAGATTIDVSYALNNVVATATADIYVVSIDITESPDIYLAPRQRVLAHGVGIPRGGSHAWTFAGPNPAIAAFNGPQSGANATLVGRQRGTVQVDLSYTVHGLVVHAQANVHVIHVAIQPPPAAALLLGNQLPLTAVGTPIGGVFTWTTGNGAVTNFNGGINNLAAITLDGLLSGTTHVDVQYSFGNAVVRDTITLDVVSVAIQEPNPVAVARPKLGQAPMTLTAVGAPLGGSYQWVVADGNIAAIQGASNLATLNLLSGAAGSTTATVTYTASGVQATAQITLHVVEVNIQEADPVALLLPAALPAATTLLHSVGVPAPGTYAWTFEHPGIGAFQGPVNQADATVATATAGLTKVRVKYTFAGVEATDERDLFVVSVTIAAGPDRAVALHRGVNPNPLDLRATGTPLNGVYTWAAQTPGIVTFQGGAPPVNSRDARVLSAGVGTTVVDVTYDLGGVQATAQINVHVIRVIIQEGDEIEFLHKNPLGPHPTLTAVGQPGVGAYAWRPMAQANAPRAIGLAYHGAINTAVASLTTQSLGDAHVRVRYTLHGAFDEEVILCKVRTESCSLIDWAPAGAGVAVAPKPFDPCLHHPSVAEHEIPTSLALGGAATAVPADPHHHGNRCGFCSPYLGRPAHHYLNSDSNSEAVAEVIALRDQIHALRALAPHQRAAFINRRPWLANIPVNGFNPLAAVTAHGVGGPVVHGKMIGVLIGYDQAGRKYRLRGVSGNFPGLGGLNPNNHWARKIPHHWVIQTASRGQQTYGAQQAPFHPNQFGKCAATHLLSEALELGLRIESMAEIWLGGTKMVGGHNRQDGEMVTSCNFCRMYIAGMLCDRGAAVKGSPYGGAAPPPNRGLLVTATEQPQTSVVRHNPGFAANTVVLHGAVSAANGAYLWTVNPPGVVAIQGAANQVNVTLATVAGGTATATLQYTLGPMVETADVVVHVAAVAIVEASPVQVNHLAQFQLNCTPAPAIPGGVIAWTVTHPAVAVVNGPNNTAAVTIDTVAQGNTTVRVTYTIGASVASAVVNLQVA